MTVVLRFPYCCVFSIAFGPFFLRGSVMVYPVGIVASRPVVTLVTNG